MKHVSVFKSFAALGFRFAPRSVDPFSVPTASSCSQTEYPTITNAATLSDSWGLTATIPAPTAEPTTTEAPLLDPACYAIQNPSFENDTLSPWVLSDPNSIVVEKSHGLYEANTGKNFLRFTFDNPAAELNISQQLTGLEPGNYYIYFATAWTDKNDTGTSDCTYKINVDDTTVFEGDNYVLDPFYYTGGLSPHKIAVEDPVISFHFSCPDAPPGGAEFLLDDVAVYPVGTRCHNGIIWSHRR